MSGVDENDAAADETAQDRADRDETAQATVGFGEEHDRLPRGEATAGARMIPG